MDTPTKDLDLFPNVYSVIRFYNQLCRLERGGRKGTSVNIMHQLKKKNW
jgi:hypothetical protein